MKLEITMGNFIFCLWQETPVMGNDCRGCQFFIQEGDTCYCIHDYEEGDED
jgi:hypothetical protein